ncbi:hypothetical protein A5855_002651, partial [Enterococcus faecium]
MKWIRRGSLCFLFLSIIGVIFSFTGAFGSDDESFNPGSG